MGIPYIDWAKIERKYTRIQKQYNKANSNDKELLKLEYENVMGRTLKKRLTVHNGENNINNVRIKVAVCTDTSLV